MKILIVDDKKENIKASQKAVNGSHDVFFYAYSEQDAVEVIEKAFKSSDLFDLVITDLEMESQNSGIEVARTAFSCLAIPYIATGRMGDGGAHGPSVSILPLIDHAPILGFKDNPEVWQRIFEVIFDHYEESGELLSSIERFKRFNPGVKVSKQLVDIYLRKFNGEGENES